MEKYDIAKLNAVHVTHFELTTTFPQTLTLPQSTRPGPDSKSAFSRSFAKTRFSAKQINHYLAYTLCKLGPETRYWLPPDEARTLQYIWEEAPVRFPARGHSSYS